MARGNFGSAYVEGVSRRQLFRLSAENRLIGDVDKWMEYHDARNETAHTYDEQTAGDVFEAAGNFITDVKELMKALESRND